MNSHPSPSTLSRRTFVAVNAGAVLSPFLPGRGALASGRHSLPPRETASAPSGSCDVAIIGGGPAGLAAALTLGRAGRTVVVFDAGAPRNAAATHIHNFVTRDGTPPAEFRRIGRAQLVDYATVSVRDAWVTSISGEKDDFVVQTADGGVAARRIILCTGMVDEPLNIPGAEAAWGHSVFQCPYCHGWEVRDKRWGFLALDAEKARHGFPALLKGWTDDVVVFLAGGVTLPDDVLTDLADRGIHVAGAAVAELEVDGTSLTHVVLDDGERVPCDVLYAHPPQRQVELVQALSLTQSAAGTLTVDPMTRETSKPGVYAAGDLSSQGQAAIIAAGTGTHTAAMANHDLCVARVTV